MAYFNAADLRDWYGSGTVMSQPNAGLSGSSGTFGQLGSLPAVGQATPYQFSDITGSFGASPASSDYRPALAKGQVAPPEFASLYEAGLLDAGGKAINAITQRGTASSPGYVPTSMSAKFAMALAERARQEAAAGKQENRERGNAILAGYDQSIANNRAMADRLMEMNQGYGGSMRQQLENDYAGRLGASNQAAIRRGLGNTTIRDSLNRGVTSAYDLARMQLGDQLAQRNIGLTTDALGRENQGTFGRLNFLSGIQNNYPTSADMGNYLLQSGVLEETKGSRK